MRTLQTRIFANALKRLHPNQKAVLDKAVRDISDNPNLGEAKVGDLAGVRVYKFKMIGQTVLLAYEWHKDEVTLVLLSIGPHENFYRDMKQAFLQ